MKIRDASNVLRTVSRIHIRDASNVSRLVSIGHLRDASNVSRVFYAAGAAGGYDFTSGAQVVVPLGSSGNYLNRKDMTAVYPGSTAPSYAWEIVSQTNPGTAYLTNATSKICRIESSSQSTDPGSGATTATVRLVMTLNGNPHVVEHDVVLVSST